jgi:hypothetical protein
MSRLSDFAKGVIAGAVASAVLFGVVFAFWFFHRRDKELIEYAEKRIEIEAVREDYRNRDPALFLEDPGVRGAADTAAREFERKRDEALQRFRGRLID